MANLLEWAADTVKKVQKGTFLRDNKIIDERVPSNGVSIEE